MRGKVTEKEKENFQNMCVKQKGHEIHISFHMVLSLREAVNW